MAITEDQRALVQLLLESGQSYEDIAGVLGIEAGEVRRRAAGALLAMQGERVAGDAGLVDYLFGQAREDVAKTARGRLIADPELLGEARRLTGLLKLIAPAGALPELPREGATAEAPPSVAQRQEEQIPEAPVSAQGEPSSKSDEPPARRARAEQSATAAPETRATGGLEAGQKRLLAVLLGTGFVVVAIVLGVSGVFSSSGGGQSSSETTARAEAAEEGLTQAVLQPTGGSGQARGRAIFGSVEGTPVLQVTAQDLQATTGSDRYNIWLYRNDRVLVRLGAVEVGQSGNLAAQFQLPAEALALVARGQLNQIDISRSPAAAYQRELARGEREGRLPRHVGTSVLRGRITGPEIPAEAAE